MNAPTYQTVPVTCPQCQTPFMTPVMSIIDAGHSPEAKALFLSGRVNVAVCPQCGNAGMLSTPIVYHDAEKELLLTFVPPELGASEVEQQRLIGNLTTQVMNSLPPEQRKGYLLNPHSFLRLDGMIEAILEADGITPEMLAVQQAKADLLGRLLRTPSEDARRIIAQENDEQIDYEFFRFLSLNIEAAQADGRSENAQELLALREQLLAWTSEGQETAAREEAIRDLGTEITRESLLEKLVEAARTGEEAKIETMVAFARPAIDYIFYQQLADQIETAEQAGSDQEAKVLKNLRESILDLTDQIDAEIQNAAEQATELLQQIADSEDPEQAIMANINQIDDFFLSVLSTNLEAAASAGRTEDVERLEQVRDILVRLIEESQPPEVQLISQLLSVEYPEGTQELLNENAEQVNATLLEYLRLIGEDLNKSGRKDMAQRLAQIQEQVAAMAK